MQAGLPPLCASPLAGSGGAILSQSFKTTDGARPSCALRRQLARGREAVWRQPAPCSGSGPAAPSSPPSQLGPALSPCGDPSSAPSFAWNNSSAGWAPPIFRTELQIPNRTLYQQDQAGRLGETLAACRRCAARGGVAAGGLAARFRRARSRPAILRRFVSKPARRLPGTVAPCHKARQLLVGLRSGPACFPALASAAPARGGYKHKVTALQSRPSSHEPRVRALPPFRFHELVYASFKRTAISRGEVSVRSGLPQCHTRQSS